MTRYTLLVTSYCLSVAVGFSQVALYSSQLHVLSTSTYTSLSLAAVNGRDGPATKTFSDINDYEQLHGEVCSIDPNHSNEYYKKRLDDDDDDEEQKRQFWQALSFIVVHLIPICNPVLAYFSYESLAQLVNQIVEFLSDNSWVAVDGGAYQAKIIAPAINGVVVPAISILFATLISNTVSSLRQRLLDIRSAINMESSDLRVLATMVDSFPPGTSRDKVRAYLIQYTCRLIAESSTTTTTRGPGGVVKMFHNNLGTMDSELYGVLAQLNTMSSQGVEEQESSSMGATVSSSSSLPTFYLSESYAAVTRLNNERCRRISAVDWNLFSLGSGLLRFVRSIWWYQ
jgi:hypothetical protein